MVYILYNPKAKNGEGKAGADHLFERFPEAQAPIDLTGIDVRGFLSERTEADAVYICGGDGTLNHLANDAEGLADKCAIYLYRGGSGNDFLHDLGDAVKEDVVEINKYLKDLPTVTVNGMERRYINGIGYGIDGEVCAVADRMRAAGKKNINYTGLAIKLLLFGYKAPNATVTVDGVTHTFKKVWIGSAMKGRFYGGGMMVAPDQDRLGEELSVVVFHGTSRLKTLMIFPKIFKGEHVKHTKAVTVLKGRNVTVSYDRPTALQIDGETVCGVTTYTARAFEKEPAGV